MRILLTFALACLFTTVTAQQSKTTLIASSNNDQSENVPSTNISSDPEEEVDSTKAVYIKAVNDNPTYVPNIDRLASYYRDLGKVDSAIYYYKRSLEIKGDGIIARQSLAAAYLVQEKHEEAIKQYKKILEKHPDYPEVYHGLARVYLSQKDYDKAIINSEVAMRWYLAGNKNLHAADARMLGGQAYMHKGDYKTAVKYFKACGKHLKDNAYYHYYIGFCYLKMGKTKNAEKFLAVAKEMGYQIPVYVKDKMAK